jgi:holo-[acyl-carrier protein] synthase
MTCVGLGVDVVGVERFARIVEKRGSRFLERLFTPAERLYCEKRVTRIEAYSARFAAKEAFLKAIGQGLRSGLRWKDVEISNDRLGKPKLNISGKAKEIADKCGAKSYLLSLSHTTECATAVVILED